MFMYQKDMVLGLWGVFKMEVHDAIQKKDLSMLSMLSIIQCHWVYEMWMMPIQIKELDMPIWDIMKCVRPSKSAVEHPRTQPFARLGLEPRRSPWGPEGNSFFWVFTLNRVWVSSTRAENCNGHNHLVSSWFKTTQCCPIYRVELVRVVMVA